MKQFLLIMIGLSSLVYADFSRSEQGVVTDSKTNLQWQDDYSDNGGSIKSAAWTDAVNYCESLALDGEDWRLPNKKELLSIVDYSNTSPSINYVFTKTFTSYYWSSTTYNRNTYYYSAWNVHFNNGTTAYSTKTTNRYVRCVRVGQ